jgi:plasmid stabilization system protein ParE
MQLILAPEAQSDLADILLYTIQLWGAEQQDRYAAALIRSASGTDPLQSCVAAGHGAGRDPLIEGRQLASLGNGQADKVEIGHLVVGEQGINRQEIAQAQRVGPEVVAWRSTELAQ